MLNVICPGCGREPLIDVLRALPGRRLEISCKRCGTVLVVDDERPASPRPSPEREGPAKP